MVKNTMILCDKSGQFLFQVLPDMFPHGRLTQVEMQLWSKFYEEKEERRKAKNG